MTVAPRRSLLRSSVIISGLAAGVSALGFANQLLVAHFFGAGPELDAYFVGVSLPLLLISLVNGMFAYWLVPQLVRERAGAAQAYALFAGQLLLGLALIGGAVAGLAGLAAPGLLRLMAPTLAPALYAEATLINRLGWLSFACAVGLYYLGAMHNTGERFILPVIAGMLPPTGMIGFCLAWAERLGPAALAWGQATGFAAGVLLLLPGCWGELRFGGGAAATWRALRPVLSPLPLVVLSMLCFSIYGTVDAVWASRLGESQVSYLGYAQRLLVAVANVITLGPMTVILPRLAAAAHAGQREQFLRETRLVLRLVLALAALMAVGLAAQALPFVTLLFERGAFTPADAAGLATTLPGLLLGMVAMAGTTILFRALHARHDRRAAAALGALGTVTYFALSGLLSQRWQLGGIVAAYALTWWLLLALTAWRVWAAEHAARLNRDMLLFTARLLIATAVSGAAGLLAHGWLLPAGMSWGAPALALRLAACGALGALAFGVTAVWVLPIAELRLPLERLPLWRRLAAAWTPARVRS
ncbi:MAG: hypothetical protein IT317_18540 [Anaerolineales bacterium]|nr:hypothetical protein [Anaerolineales bacterium]